MSSRDIEQASFGEVADGAWDAADVRAFLVDVADHVRRLEHRIDEAQEMRDAAVELVAQAEALVDQAKDQAEATPEATAIEAERLITDAEARAHRLESEAAARIRAIEAEVAATLERSEGEATRIVRNAERTAAQLVADAEKQAHEIESAATERARVAETEAAAAVQQSKDQSATIVLESERLAGDLIEEAQFELGWRRIEAAARVEHERAAIRRDADTAREVAKVDAVAVVAGALEQADRVTQRALDTIAAEPGRAEVERIVAEAETLLENARVKSESILAEAKERAAGVDAGGVLGDEVRRSVAALRSVADARTRLEDSGPVQQVRGRALQMLAELRRTDGEIPPTVRAELADELHALQDVIAKLEVELLGDDAGSTRVVLDLTDDAGDEDDFHPTRPSRYQQRSANLPKIGSRVENVNKAMQSLRSHVKDQD